MKRTKLIVAISLLFVLSSCGNGDNDSFIEESGNIETTNIILSSQASGQIEEVYFDEGDEVKEGDTLLIIDHELQLIKLKQAIAGKNAAKAKLDLAISGARTEDILVSEEQFKQAKLNFELSKADFNRMKNLFDEQAITQKQFDDVETKFNIAESQLNSAKGNLKKIRNFSRPEEITQIEANYQNATANVELIKKQISDSKIIAPINAFVVERYIEIGETVNHGSSVFKLADLSIVELVVYINEENLGKIKLGQSVKIKTDSFKNKEYPGEVVFISPEAEFTPKNIQTKDERTKLVFAVKIEVPNPEFELKAGMPADAKIDINNEAK